MKVTLKLYATLGDYLPADAKSRNLVDLEVPEDTTVAQLIERYNLPQKLVHLVLIDGHFVPPGDRAVRRLHNGETLAVWPPIAGG